MNNQKTISTGAVAQFTILVVMMYFASFGDVHANIFDNFANAVLSVLNSTFLRVLAIIAVIFVGIRALRGRMEWEGAFFIMLGIVLIFGAAGIVDFVRDNAGTL